MRSLSEIETTAKRATRAAGFSWGNSEEVGKCIRLLELFGLPGIQNLNQYYKDRAQKKFENLNLIKEINKPASNVFCPIILGISFLDQIRSLEHYKKIEFHKIGYPLIFISFLSRASEIIGKKILIKFDQNEILFNLNVNIQSNLFKKDFPLIANNVEIIFVENQDNFTALEWDSLYKLAEDTFVEESESLKKAGAGAGLTDND